MGCVCGKPSAIEDSRESPRERYGQKSLSEVRLPRVASSRREDAYRLKPQSNNNGSGGIILDKHVNGSVRLPGENLERKRDKGDLVVISRHPSVGSVPRATEGEQVAAVWQPWLAAVAVEAVPRRADSFEKLEKLNGHNAINTSWDLSTLVVFQLAMLWWLLLLYGSRT